MHNDEWRICRGGDGRCEEDDNGEKNVSDVDGRRHWENSRELIYRLLWNKGDEMKRIDNGTFQF